MKKVIAILMFGLLGGGAGGWFAHERLAPQLGLEGEEVEALVIEERAEDERLVLTLQAGERTLLISFRERRDDVASLVAEGDTLLVRVPRSGPFADDPAIVEVRRAEGHSADDVGSEDEEADADADGEPTEEAVDDTGEEAESVDETDGEPSAEEDEEAGEETVSEAPATVATVAT